MKNNKKHPIVEPNCALFAYLQAHRDDSAAGFRDTLWTASELFIPSKLHSAISSLWTEAHRVERALKAYVNLYLPEVPDNGSPGSAFFAEMSANIEECPLDVVLTVIEGIYELLPRDSELLQQRTVAHIAEGQELNDMIKRFLANFDLLLEQLKNDSLEDWDWQKDLREYLEGKSGPNASPAQTKEFARQAEAASA